MTIHYSKYRLNTYMTTPYFQSQIPPEYPTDLVLMSCRAYRRLPPNLRKLAELAKEWAVREYGPPAGILGIENYYDEGGYELDPDSGKRLTDEEIDAEWDLIGIGQYEVIEDIPIPPGGFVDPDVWEQPPAAIEPRSPEDIPTKDMLLSYFLSHGRKRTMEEYGAPSSLDKKYPVNEDLADAILKGLG